MLPFVRFPLVLLVSGSKPLPLLWKKGESASLPALDEAVGLPRSCASSSVDSYRAEVDSREFGSLKQSVPKFSGVLEDFPLWKEQFEVLTSMVGCTSSFFAVHDTMIGDVSEGNQYNISQGFSEEHIKTATCRAAWICLTESIMNRDLPGTVFATKLPRAGWRMLCDWFLPETMAEQVKWSMAFDAAKMVKGGDPWNI